MGNGYYYDGRASKKWGRAKRVAKKVKAYKKS